MNQEPFFSDQIDILSDRFERAFQSGERLAIESLLGEIDESQQANLLAKLLALELRYRRDADETPLQEDYVDRFSEMRDTVDDAFRDLQENAATDPADVTTHPPEVGEDRTVVQEDVTLTPRANDGEDATLPPDPKYTPGVAIQQQTSWKVGGSIRYFADYELLNEIARGGMGVVYRARQTSLNRIVALKMILSGQLAGEQEVQRFHAEAEAAAKLDHPGIVPIYEVGEFEGQHFFSMGFVDGSSLSDLVAEQPMAPREAADLTMKIADAIGYAHEQGVIHRDLKPANVLIQKRPEGGESKSSVSTSTTSGSQSSVSGLAPRITDFGLAKQVEGDDQLTASGQILGTPSYMPPEQASGKIDEIDHRSDIYSVGGILYALITGRPPFQAASHLDTLMQVLEKDPVPPRQLDPKLPRDIETIALKALEKDPRRRYQSAAELSDDLGRFLNGEPIQARSITQFERVWRWAHRKPIVAGLGALAASLLLVVSIGGPIVAYQQSSLRSVAQQREGEANQAKRAAEDAAELEKAARQEAVAAGNALTVEKERAERTLYARTISLAYQEWHDNNVHRAEDLLNRTDHKFRDWEWQFVKKLCNSEKQTLRGHTGIPFRMRLTSDGKHLISIGSASPLSADANVYVWELETGTVIKRLPYRGFAISPDGKYVALEMKSDAPVIIMNVMTEVQITSIPAHGGGTAWANFNSDGTRLVTTGPDSSIRIWNTATGEKLLDITDRSRRRVHDVDFSTDDRLLVWKTVQGLIQINDAGSGEKLMEIEDPIYRADAVRVVISPDNEILAAASNGPINLFDLSSGEQIGTLRGHSSSVLGLAFSPDGNRLASCGVDGTVRVWDVAERRESFRYRGHKFGVTYGVFEVIYSDDGKWILSGGSDKTIKIWPADANDGFAREVALESADDVDVVQAASVYPDPSQEKDWLVGNLNYVDAVAFSRDGELVATASEDDTVRIFDLDTRENIYTFREHKQNVAAVAFHPDGLLIASGEGGLNDKRKGNVLIWDRTTGQVTQKLDGHTGPISALRFSPDGTKLYSSMGSQGIRHRGEVIAWDAATGNQLFKYENLGGVHKMDLSHDGQRLAAATFNGPIQLLDTNNGELQRKIGGAGEIFFAVAFSADGKRLAAGKTNWAVSVWDVENGNRQWEQIEHSGAVMDIAFNPSGTRVISVSVDRTTKIWDSNSGDMLISLLGDAFELFGVAISPDGNTLACFGEAPYVTLRDLGGAAADQLAVDDGEWPEIFSDDFERDELGKKWTTSHGTWMIENGAARGTLAALPSIPGFSATTMTPKAWMPSVVAIEYDVWAPKGVLFETKLHDESAQNGLGSLFLAKNTPFNQGRTGAAVFVQASGAFNEVARSAGRQWFEPNKKYRLKSIRRRDRWEMFIDGKPVLEGDVPASMWVPVLHIQGSFADPGAILFVDNVVVRAPESMQDEMAATGLEYLLRQDLKLKSFVINAIESKNDISDQVRKLAIRFAKLQKQDSAQRKKIIWEALLAGDRETSAYQALIDVLREDVKLSDDDWEYRQMLAAAYYRAGQFETTLTTLRDSEANFQRLTAMSHPVNMSLLALTAAAMNDSRRTTLATSRLTELMRSDDWQSDDDAVAWHKLVVEEVSIPEPADVRLAAEIEAIKQLTFEPQQRAVCKFDLDDYLDTFADDAVQIDGRSAAPTKYDVQMPIGVWKEAIEVFSRGAPALHASLVRSRADVTITGNEATLIGDYTFTIPVGHWRWQSEEKLRKSNDGWKIYRRRHGITGFTFAGKTYVASPGDWKKLDAAVEEVRRSGPPRHLVQPLVVAFHLQESFDLMKKLTEKPDIPAQIWGGLADRAFGVSDAEEMLRAGKKAVQMMPGIPGPSFIRALAVEENLSEEPIDVGQGVKVRMPTFIQEAPDRDFAVPGKVLRAWYPTNTSALLIFHAPGAIEEGETLRDGMEGLTSAFQTALKVQVHRKELTTVNGLEAADIIMEGFGSGRSMGMPRGIAIGTVQRWIVIHQGDDLIGILLTAATNEFDQRNAEFSTWLKYVEIDFGDAAAAAQ